MHRLGIQNHIHSRITGTTSRHEWSDTLARMALASSTEWTKRDEASWSRGGDKPLLTAHSGNFANDNLNSHGALSRDYRRSASDYDARRGGYVDSFDSYGKRRHWR